MQRCGEAGLRAQVSELHVPGHGSSPGSGVSPSRSALLTDLCPGGYPTPLSLHGCPGEACGFRCTERTRPELLAGELQDWELRHVGDARNRLVATIVPHICRFQESMWPPPICLRAKP